MTVLRDIVVRYSEIGLKGKNRPDFEKRLVSNLKQALEGLPFDKADRPRGRVLIRGASRPEETLKRVVQIPGVQSASIALHTAPEQGAILEAGRLLVGEALDRGGLPDPPTFKVETSRTCKAFPVPSMEFSAWLGGELIRIFPCLKARMKTPDILLSVEIRSDEALVASLHETGPGGLPVGSTGKVVALLSGGIDSPVAAYMAMRRGARVIFVNYHSYPFIPEESLDKIKDLVRRLCVFQGGGLLFVVPFSEIQVAIKKHCPEELRTVLYRRMMMRLAERVAAETGALALVTGESLGQVASQTLENMRCIGAASTLPVLRPLVGFDKVETIARAEAIGTYALSIRPFPDCCTVFQPRRPKIRAALAQVEEAEACLDTDGLVHEAFGRLKRIRF